MNEENTPTENQPTVITDWRESLPESVQQWEETKNAADINAFFNNMNDMRSMIGRSLQIPGPDASVEKRQEYLQKLLDKSPEVMLKPDPDKMGDFFDSMGRPKDFDAYKVPDSTDDLPINGDSVAMFKQMAYEAGLTQSQFEKITLGMSKKTLENANIAQSERQTGQSELKTEWGAAYNQNLAIAEKIKNEHFQHLDFPIGELDSGTIKSLHSLGKAMIGEGMEITNTDGSDAIMTPAEAKTKIDEILTNKDHAYWQRQHPGHKAAIERVIDLHKLVS